MVLHSGSRSDGSEETSSTTGWAPNQGRAPTWLQTRSVGPLSWCLWSSVLSSLDFLSLLSPAPWQPSFTETFLMRLQWTTWTNFRASWSSQVRSLLDLFLIVHLVSVFNLLLLSYGRFSPCWCQTAIFGIFKVSLKKWKKGKQMYPCDRLLVTKYQKIPFKMASQLSCVSCVDNSDSSVELQ